MSYQALYRVWRPQTFTDVAGQSAITRTLRNALSHNKTSHAYLFTGPRGTGKTSAAKIFAKAINCPNLKDGEPCNNCALCESITNGQLNDVIEIDAASNNGVEEIRDIREKANYAPTSAENKVYIIDEVHMLSTGAFNALLKTLEEPPAHVIFILATTEPHKIPLTIISRTQRFDFKQISQHDIIQRMMFILEKEDVVYEDEALTLIARAAQGGMRDALSILDQAVSFSNGKITTNDAVLVTGSMTQEFLLDYFHAIQENETENGLNYIRQILGEGKDPSRFLEDLILFSRDLLVFKQAPGEEELLKIAEVGDRFKALSEAFDAQILYEMIDICNETQKDLRLSNHAEVYLEVATVKLTQLTHTMMREEQVRATTNQPVDISNEQVESLQRELQEVKQTIQQLQDREEVVPKKPIRKVSPATSSDKPFKPNATAIFNVLGQATKEHLASLRDVWPDLMHMLSVTQRAVMKASNPVAASPDGLIVSFEYDILCRKATNDERLIREVGTHLAKLTGHQVELNCVPEDQWQVLREQYISQMRAGQATTGSQDEESEMNEESPTDSKETNAENESNEIVSKAVEFFGKDVVEIE